MTVQGQDQDLSDDVVVSTKDQLAQDNVTTALESTQSKQVSPSVATNSGTPSIKNQTVSKSIGIALQANDCATQSTDPSRKQWSGIEDKDAQDEFMSSPIRSKLCSRHTATTPAPTPSGNLNPFLVQEPELRTRSLAVGPSIGQDTVDGGDDEDEVDGQALYDERERHSDYSSGTSTPTLAITPTPTVRTRARISPSTGPSSPSTRPMTRSTSKNQFLESLDQDDDHQIRLMNQQRQTQTTPTHQVGSAQPQPVKRNHTVDLWGRAYYETTRNSLLTRTPSKKRNAQGETIRFMSPPGRAFDPLSYDPLTQYKLKIPRLPDQEDEEKMLGGIDSEQDDLPALATQEDEEDSFRTPKRKRRSTLPLMKLERPFATRSFQSSVQEPDEQDPERILELDAVYPDDGIDSEGEEDPCESDVQDDGYLDEEGLHDEDPDEEDHINADQEAEIQGHDDLEGQILQQANTQDDVHNDTSEEDEGDKSRSSVQSTPRKYSQRDRLLLDLNSRGPSHFIENDFQTPPRKMTARDQFNNLQPPPAPRVPDWAMISLSDRQSRYVTPRWIPPSGSEAGESPSRSRSLRTPSFGSMPGSSKNPRN